MTFRLNRIHLRRVLEDKLRGELARLQSSGTSLPPPPWAEDLPIGVNGVGADSLDTLSLAGAVNAMFHIHETGLEDALLARKTFGTWLDLIEQAWSSGVTRISFTTSGSTGQPRLVTHRLADLTGEAAEHARRLLPRRIFAAVPSHHIYGFIFTALLPQVAGAEVTDCRARPPAPPPFAASDLLVSFPEHWAYLAQSLPNLPPLTGISSTAPLPAALAVRLRGQGLARLVEIYGASETAGIGWREAADAPYTLLDRWAEACPDGLTLRGTDGQTAALPDHIRLAGPRTVFLEGRADGAIQIGGMNVVPARVAEALQSHPSVAVARVRATDGPVGPRLKALVVPHDPRADPEGLCAALMRWSRDTLPAQERPIRIAVARSLPRGELGKEADWP